MIPGWVKSFVAWLMSLFVHEAVEQVKEEINQPNTIQNANTPKSVDDKYIDAYQQWLRKKQDDSNK